MDHPNLPTVPDTERAWAAGFFDGEGCCGAYTYGRAKTRARIQLSVCQIETTTLRRFYDAIGQVGTLLYVPPRTKCPNARWDVLVAAMGDIEQAVHLLWPYLSGPKRAQIQQAFDTRAANLQRPEGLSHPGQKLTDTQVTEIRALLASGTVKQSEIAAMYGTTQQTVSYIGQGRRKADGQRARAGRKPTATRTWPVTTVDPALDQPEWIGPPAAQPPATERAWAAGFFDAEGCAGVRLGRYLNLSVTQTETSTLERFSRALGGLGRIYTHGRNQPAHWTPGYSLQISSRVNWLHAVSVLWEFLSPPKRRQIVTAYDRRAAATGVVPI
jgi:hypothetical protein